MCGITALQLRNPAMRPQMGDLMRAMLCEMVERGPDSAGLAIYDNPELVGHGESTLSLLGGSQALSTDDLTAALAGELPVEAKASVAVVGDTTLVSGDVSTDVLAAALKAVLPQSTIIGRGAHLAVMKSVGDPLAVADDHGLSSMSGTQGVTHTRMATESAVTAAGSHPFAVADDLCLVHNGSFSNHATIRRDLERTGVTFDSQNDTEVGARYVASRLQQGDTLEQALVHLGEVFDGFYTLVVTTADSMAIVRDPIACKPAIIAETDDYIAMASEYRSLDGLPGIENARIFEPEPGRVYTWSL